MLLKILKKLACPLCNEPQNWQINGDLTEVRIVDGVVTCKNSHSWQVREEILRFDQQNSDEEMQFLDRDKTGFPSTELVPELERGNFLTKFNEYVDSFPLDTLVLLKVTGPSILFFKYIRENQRPILVVNPDEGVLRQIQVLAARKQIYKNMSFIRAEDANLSSRTNSLRFYFSAGSNPTLNKEDTAILFDTGGKGTIIWKSEEMSLFERKFKD
jgi:hypothetical protein